MGSLGHLIVNFMFINRFLIVAVVVRVCVCVSVGVHACMHACALQSAK